MRSDIAVIGTDMPSVMPTICIESVDLNSEPEVKALSESRNRTDSGIDSDNDFVVPELSLLEKIVTQVELYFSDENLIKDEFILKHIRRNKDGFISLKLLSSFRKVKVLTKDWKVVAHCVRIGSKKLELNESETKIRRKTPLPALDGDKYSRTVIVLNITVDVENISKEFSKFGDIALIRVHKNGTNSVIPSNLLAIIANKYDLTKTTVATIEYNNKSDAEKALKCMEQKRMNNWRNGIEVMAMKTSIEKISKNSLKTIESIENRENNKRNACFDRPNPKTVVLDRNNISKRPLISRQKSKSYSSGDDIKLLTIASNQRPFYGNTNNTRPVNKALVNVIRSPRGPDGTIGFNSSRNQRSNSEP